MSHHPVQFPDLRPLLRPKSLAIVGATEKPGPASRVLQNLQTLGFRGPVYGVHPRNTLTHGYRCYPALHYLPDVPECLAVAVAAASVPNVLREAAEVGVKAAVVYGSGFGEVAGAGRALQDELCSIARESGMVICGPNCIGLCSPAVDYAACSVSLTKDFPRGDIGAVVQSGSIAIGLLESGRRLGFSYLISSGNEAVTDSADYINFLARDSETRIILAFIEEFRSLDKLAKAADRAADAGKPIIVVKVGRSEAAQRAVMAHTGALAGSDALHDVFFRRHGITRARDLDEMLEMAALFSKASLPGGDGVGLITISGGQLGLLADLAEDLHLRFPALSKAVETNIQAILPNFSTAANPLDAWGLGDLANAYPRCLEQMASDEAISLVAISLDAPAAMSQANAEYYYHVAHAAVSVARRQEKPVLLFSNLSAGLQPGIRRIVDEGGVPMLQGMQESLRAIRSLIDYADFLRQRKSKPLRQDLSDEPLNIDPEILGQLSKGALSEHRSKQLLAAFGIPVTREALAMSPEEARRVAQDIGYPVALKISSPDIIHKSDVGAVCVGIRNGDEVSKAYATLLHNAQSYRPNARIEGVLVQEMVAVDRAVELIAGITFDAKFGHSLLIGVGGVFVELCRDVALRLAPIDEAEAHAMLNELRAHRLLDGFRGRPPADCEAVAMVLLALSKLAQQLGDRISEVDINPLFVLPTGEGAVAADALIIGKTGP